MSRLRRPDGAGSNDRPVRVTVHLHPDVEEQLRLYCAKARCSLSYAVEEALINMLPLDEER